ncbi:MAG: VCBS repeat-containing protein [Bacteroidetes bacterium]|nr:VCBS repeat-containing protein [Bacteroidota bacterium]
MAESHLFEIMGDESGISFTNELSITERSNPYTYRSFYNGAGVGIADINNDGLPDIYFCGNQVDNKLYLNKGNLKFEDITQSAGVACSGVWTTGVTFADVNADGLMDIYVCKSGDPSSPNRSNELFINNGNLTFTEKAKEFGLDVKGLSVQAAFFDYDKDGDLDCYLLTNSIRSVGNFDLVKDQRNVPDPNGEGNRFFVNENGKFLDYSAKAGIYRSRVGFGLGITLGDFNSDSWTDIFVSNDFFERDYLYINDQKGAFKESLTNYFQSISMGSMGADFADLDNDGYPELFVTEMLPDSLNRRKSKTIYESWNKYQLNLQNGYYHQFSRNVLQKRIGDTTYVEIGRLAGVAASEWSWGALLFDMDNDGNRDIFIANGIYKDLLDRDYLTYAGAEENVRKIIKEEKNAIMKLIDLMPSSKFPNYAFKNEGKFNFKNKSNEWGFEKPMYSTGSSYGDLDNDGDMDLVINNINSPSVIYRNNSDSSLLKGITISFSSKGKNTFLVGTKVKAYCGASIYSADNFTTRGFQSSVEPKIHMGLGNTSVIDSLLFEWPEGGYSVVYNVSTNREIKIQKEDFKIEELKSINSDPEEVKFHLDFVSRGFKHKGNELVDFNRERLLPMMYSNESPSLVVGDIDNNGISEVYVGGGKDQEGSFIRYENGVFKYFLSKAIQEDKISEETKATLFDADMDGDLDLYKSNGGRFFPKQSSALMDRMFINNGKGEFIESPYALPFTDFVSTSVSKPIDFDNDGDLDLIIGERFHPFIYGVGGRGYLFENNGEGKFKDVTNRNAAALANIGMITDVSIGDFDKDGWQDILLVGDWMPITALKNDNGIFADHSRQFKLNGTEGWWHDVETADLNKDGRPDFVIGNHGKNTFFSEGDRMYVSDFDRNGSIEQLICTKVGDKYYPIIDKDELLSQLPSLKKKLLFYKDYSNMPIDHLFPNEILSGAKLLQLNMLSSIVMLSDENGYKIIELPIEAQYSPIYALSISDFDNDGIDDLIAGGNQHLVKPQFGRFDASTGWFFKGAKKGKEFSFDKGISLNVKGQIRALEHIEIKGNKYLMFAKYDDYLEIYKIPH